MARVHASFALLVGLLTAGSARAWANAQVTHANADVTLRPDASAAVRLDLRLKVLGGWLTDVELAGFDEGLVLDSSAPPTFATEGGEPAEFEVRTEGGRITFHFPRGHSPRVGNYAASVAYVAPLHPEARGESQVVVPWTFPGWAAGLDDVSLSFRGPTGLVVASDEPGVTRSRVDGAERLHRVHLPQSLSWTVALEVPRGGMDAAVLPPAPSAPPRVASVVARERAVGRPVMRWVALAFVLLALVKRLGFARTAKRRGATARPLVPMPGVLASVVVIGLGVAAERTFVRAPELAMSALLGIVLLAVQRLAVRDRAPRLGGWTSATPADRRTARWEAFVERLSPVAWVDAQRPLGFVVVTALVSLLYVLHREGPADSPHALFTVPDALALLAAMGFVSGSRLVPASVAGRLLAMEAFARRLRLPDAHGRGFGFRLAMHRDAQGAAQDARLRLFADERVQGVVRLDVACRERGGLGGYELSPVVLCVVRKGSEAERILGRHAPSPQVSAAPGGRRARVLPALPSTFVLLDRLALPSEVPVRVRGDHGAYAAPADVALLGHA